MIPAKTDATPCVAIKVLKSFMSVGPLISGKIKPRAVQELLATDNDVVEFKAINLPD